jgi:hypothetical protein
VTDLSRRDFTAALAAAPLVALGVSRQTIERALARTRDAAYRPRFFTADEWPTVQLLADLVLPRDERSGSATDAGTHEFMDFVLDAEPPLRDPIRDGLAWLEAEARSRFRAPFVAISDAQRAAILDDIAWPGRVRPDLAPGARFFSAFRDLVASGFWSSRVGVADLQYLGNTGQATWTGCPPAALEKLGVSYDHG